MIFRNSSYNNSPFWALVNNRVNVAKTTTKPQPRERDGMQTTFYCYNFVPAFLDPEMMVPNSLPLESFEFGDIMERDFIEYKTKSGITSVKVGGTVYKVERDGTHVNFSRSLWVPADYIKPETGNVGTEVPPHITERFRRNLSGINR